MKSRRIGETLRQMLGFLFGCSEHGIVQWGPLGVIRRCRLHVWHAGNHDFS